METLLGLPAHPLLVHAAVVLIPLAVLAHAVTGWRRAWQKQYALPILAIAIVGAVFAFLAASSGEPLKNQVQTAARAANVRFRIGDHQEQGDMARNFAVLFAFLLAGAWAAIRWREQLRLPAWTWGVAYALPLAAGLIGTLMVVNAGHSGASLVWKDQGNYVTGASSSTNP